MEDQVKGLIAKHFGISEDAVKGSFMDDIGADSLDVVELVMQFEEHFDMEIPDDDAEKLTTVELVIDYIKANG
tara:strand:- start:1050 stop:1268 length:219 start_codon:yes stop_codon:yes gene_type:complete